MDLHDRVESEMKSALKGRDSVRLSVLRMLLAAIRTIEIESNTKKLDDTEILKVIQRQIKQHKESIDQFAKGGRNDLVAKESQELGILESYLPEQLSAEELEIIIKEALSETGASTRKDLGKVMKAVLEKARGRADGKTINQSVMKYLK